MKIVSLIENTACAPCYASEHGLSLYLETGNKKILFDTGQTDAFADNAEKLGVELEAVDVAVISHGHYDHGGGIARFLKLNSHAPVYINRYAFGDYYNATGKYIGLDKSLAQNGRLIFTDDALKIYEGLELVTCNERERAYPTDSAGLTEKCRDGFIPDSFRHEQYLIIREEGIKVVLSGCSHKGILNIMHWLEPDVLAGGFHFMKKELSSDGNAFLNKASETLLGYNTMYYTCHCTGYLQYMYLKERMGAKLRYLAGGEKVEI